MEEQHTEKLTLTINQFCRSVNVGRTKTYELIKSGAIKTVRIGRRRLIPTSEARRLANEGGAK